MKVLSLITAATLALAVLSPALAADMSVKAAPVSKGYPTTKCGFFYGVGTGGSAGAVEGATIGTQIVQGDLDAMIGYTCPFLENSFWFAEASFGYTNINGSVNGLALSGPLIFTQRFGAGSPINALFNPFANSLSLPSLPALPNGVTTGPANGYFFAGAVEQDITAQIAVNSSTKQWVIAPLVGFGLLTRVSNGVVIDTWAGWQMNSQSFCPNGGSTCGRLGNAARVGVAFKY